MEEFDHIFEGVADPRKSNATRHDLHEMLMIGLLSTMCGGEGCSDMALFGHTKREFLDSFMTLKHGIPSHDAFSDLFNALDPLKLQTVLARLVEGFSDQLGDVIAVDGKALRRSYDRAKKKSALHLVQAFATHSRLVLGQVTPHTHAIATQSNHQLLRQDLHLQEIEQLCSSLKTESRYQAPARNRQGCFGAAYRRRYAHRFFPETESGNRG